MTEVLFESLTGLVHVPYNYNFHLNLIYWVFISHPNLMFFVDLILAYVLQVCTDCNKFTGIFKCPGIWKKFNKKETVCTSGMFEYYRLSSQVEMLKC